MQAMSRFCRASIVCLLLLLAGIGTVLEAQERMTIQATGMGTSTQMGKIVNVNIHIEQYSTEEDRNALISAFKKSGQDGMVKVLEDMKAKGRIRFASGGVGNDIKYIMELPSENGETPGFYGTTRERHLQTFHTYQMRRARSSFGALLGLYITLTQGKAKTIQT
jgi:hypothetical protein